MKVEIKNQSQLFNLIWEEREHKSQISGQPLLNKGHLKWHWQFSHILPKGLYPKFKLERKNVILMTPEEHQLWGERPDKIRHQPKWAWIFELHEKLKQEYHNGETRN